jgi:hypothetical protein
MVKLLISAWWTSTLNQSHIEEVDKLFISAWWTSTLNPSHIQLNKLFTIA